MKLAVTTFLCVSCLLLVVSTPSEAAVAPFSETAIAPLPAFEVLNAEKPAACIAVRASSSLKQSTCCENCYQNWINCQETNCGEDGGVLCNACWRVYVYWCAPSCGGC